jgi:predicted outer membrane repeat protein
MWLLALSLCCSSVRRAIAQCAPYVQLPQAIVIANSNDALQLGNMTACPDQLLDVQWAGAVTLLSTIVVGAGTVLSITGTTADAAIDGTNTVGLFDVTGELTLSGVTLRNGYQQAGGAVLCQVGCSLSISTCVFSKNSATYGAAIYTYSNRIYIFDSTFEQNAASTAAGAIYIDTDLQQQTVSSLKRLIATSVPTIVNTVFDTNTAVEEGGAILFRCKALTLNGCTLYGNTAGTSGGAIYDYRNASALNKPNDTFKLSNNMFISNKAATKQGGALYLTATTAITRVSVTTKYASV